MKAYSRKYPSLLVSDLGIRFVNGEADVPDDPKIIERLKSLESFGVELEKPKPRKRARRKP